MCIESVALSRGAARTAVCVYVSVLLFWVMLLPGIWRAEGENAHAPPHNEREGGTGADWNKKKAFAPSYCVQINVCIKFLYSAAVFFRTESPFFLLTE
jgi:hypothetical protein